MPRFVLQTKICPPVFSQVCPPSLLPNSSFEKSTCVNCHFWLFYTNFTWGVRKQTGGQTREQTRGHILVNWIDTLAGLRLPFVSIHWSESFTHFNLFLLHTSNPYPFPALSFMENAHIAVTDWNTWGSWEQRELKNRSGKVEAASRDPCIKVTLCLNAK